MSKISCDVIKDLMPLVIDKVASEDSEKLVIDHLANCDKCKALYENDIDIKIDDNNILSKMQRKLNLIISFVLIIGMLFGLSLSNGQYIFNNVMIMPLIGVISYYLLKWKALFISPSLIIGLNIILELLKLLFGNNFIDFISLIFWSIIYSIFVIIGIVIGGLLHYAFKKDI